MGNGSGIDARLFSFRLRASQCVLKSQTRNQYFIVLCGRAPYGDRLTRQLRDVGATEHVNSVTQVCFVVLISMYLYHKSIELLNTLNLAPKILKTDKNSLRYDQNSEVI